MFLRRTCICHLNVWSAFSFGTYYTSILCTDISYNLFLWQVNSITMFSFRLQGFLCKYIYIITHQSKVNRIMMEFLAFFKWCLIYSNIKCTFIYKLAKNKQEGCWFLFNKVIQSVVSIYMCGLIVLICTVRCENAHFTGKVLVCCHVAWSTYMFLDCVC